MSRFQALLAVAYALSALAQLGAISLGLGNLWLITWGICILLVIVLLISLSDH